MRGLYTLQTEHLSFSFGCLTSTDHGMFMLSGVLWVGRDLWMSSGPSLHWKQEQLWSDCLGFAQFWIFPSLDGLSVLPLLMFPCCNLCLLPHILLLCNSRGACFPFLCALPLHIWRHLSCLSSRAAPPDLCFRQHSPSSVHPRCPASCMCEAQGLGRVLFSRFGPSLSAQQ